MNFCSELIPLKIFKITLSKHLLLYDIIKAIFLCKHKMIIRGVLNLYVKAILEISY